jgi:hypothetical protein
MKYKVLYNTSKKIYIFLKKTKSIYTLKYKVLYTKHVEVSKMKNMIEYIQKNKNAIKDEETIFEGYKISGIGNKCLQIENRAGYEYIQWDEFIDETGMYNHVSKSIKKHYQTALDEENQKEIQEAINFVEEDEERIACLQEEDVHPSVFEECMRQGLINYAGLSKLGKEVLAALEESNEDSSETISEKEEAIENTSEIDVIKMENHLSGLIGKDVKILLKKPENFTRTPNDHINIEGVEFELHDIDSCILYAFPENPELFKVEEEFELTERCIETLEYISEHGQEDGFHQYERDLLDEKGYIRFDFPTFKYVLTEKGKQILDEKEDEKMTIEIKTRIRKGRESLDAWTDFEEEELLFPKEEIVYEDYRGNITNKIDDLHISDVFKEALKNTDVHQCMFNAIPFASEYHNMTFVFSMETFLQSLEHNNLIGEWEKLKAVYGSSIELLEKGLVTPELIMKEYEEVCEE